MQHYTYLIKYKNGLKYMGVRSCKGNPEDDTKYVGSSKHTPHKSEVAHKEILAIFPSRIEAVKAEITFHAENDIGNNTEFYNRAKQTSTGFDTSGVSFVHTPEHRQKIKEALTGRKRSPEECAAISKAKTGSTHAKPTEETKQKMRDAQLGKTRSKDAIAKSVAKRKANNSYISTDETKLKISNALLENPPFVTKVLIKQGEVETEYYSIKECSRKTGIKYSALRGRLQRIPGKYTNGWSIKYVTE